MHKHDKILIKHLAVSAVAIVGMWIGALNLAYHVTFATMMMIFTLAMILSCVIMTHNIMLKNKYDEMEEKH